MTSAPTTRIEHDLIGERELPNSVYYGVHTLRALENFPITGVPISQHPDLVIAPVPAFDRRGGRVGQGGGHYDRTLEALRAGKKVFVLGLAYSGQEIEAAPMESHDQKLDAILTETGYIEVEKT